MDSQFCQVHTPHPLGKDRDRFLYLINDIQNRKDDYATQLSHITLASMSSTQTAGDGSKHEILSSLLDHGATIQNDAADKELEELWQARLILEIATILDKEMEEVARSLVSLEESETDLFAKLKGKDEEGDDDENLYQDLMKIKSKLDKPRTESIQTRVRAWLRLIQGSEIPRCPVWTTCRQEATDSFFENFEKKNNRPPQMIAELALPTRTGGTNQHALEKLLTFRSEAKDQLQEVHQLLSTATTGLLADPDFSQFADRWNTLLEHHYPVKKFGRGILRFYLFTNNVTEYTGRAIDKSEQGATTLAIFDS